MLKNEMIARRPKNVSLGAMEKALNSPLLYIVNHGKSSKLEGFHSISSCCLCNKFCLARMLDPESICSDCFAAAHGKQYFATTMHNWRNTELLQDVIDWDLLPVVFDLHFRLESFGDVQNRAHMINFINICKKNPKTTFTLWTKSTGIVTAALDEFGKPENLILIQSSKNVNEPEEPVNEYFDHVFTVYEPEYAKENNIAINCGGRKCKECMRCYDPENTELHVSELKK